MKRGNKVADNDGTQRLPARQAVHPERAGASTTPSCPRSTSSLSYYLETAKQKAGHDVKRKTVATNVGKQKKVDTQALELAALVCSQAIRKNPNYAPIHNTAGMIPVELGEPERGGAGVQHRAPARSELLRSPDELRGREPPVPRVRAGGGGVPRGPQDAAERLRRAPGPRARAARSRSTTRTSTRMVGGRQRRSSATAKQGRARAPRDLLQRGDPHAGVQGEVGRQAARPRAPQSRRGCSVSSSRRRAAAPSSPTR